MVSVTFIIHFKMIHLPWPLSLLNVSNELNVASDVIRQKRGKSSSASLGTIIFN